MPPNDSKPASDHLLNRLLERIPLPLRVGVYGLSFLAFVLIGLPWLAYRVDVLWPAYHVDVGPLRWFGWALFVVLVSTYCYASFILTYRGRGAYVEFDPPKAFVATGPFRWCRNPVAGSLVLALGALALALSSTGVLLLFLAAMLLAHAQVVWLEEPLLARRFGEPYRQYLRTVPRWIPRPPGRRQEADG